MNLATKILAVLAVALVADIGPGFCQEKEKKKTKFKSTIIELTEDAPAEWLLKEAKVGLALWSDKDYAISDLPEEMAGCTVVQRPHSATWLPANTVTALKEGTVYVMMRTKYLRKTELGEIEFNKFEKEGWKEVEGEIASTFPSGEGWEWKAYKKSIKKGPQILQLKTLNLDRKEFVFFFK